jgi:hypothetical protein
MDAPLNNSIPLEQQFQYLFTKKVNIRENCNFKDYREPNEGSPEGIAEHLENSEPGIHIYTGSERAFFGACFSDSSKCHGVIVRDINLKIIAYVNFNTLLLRLSKTRVDYVELTRKCDDKYPLKGRISVIENLIINNDLPDYVRSYHLKHLNDFALAYFSVERSWRTTRAKHFKECRYDLHDHLFAKVQAYAKSGNFIAIQGSINDLSFTKDRKISVVDTSNIFDYVFLNIKGLINSETRIIFTYWNMEKTKYFSYIHEALTKNEEIDFDNLLKALNLSSSSKYSARWVKQLAQEVEGDFDPLNYPEGPIYSRRMLNMLKDHLEKNFIEMPDGAYFEITDDRKLNQATKEQIKSLSQNEKIKKHLTYLISSWSFLNISSYLAFSKVDGWKEEFKNQFIESSNFVNFVKKLEKNNLLEEFIQFIGLEDFNVLKTGITSSPSLF